MRNINEEILKELETRGFFYATMICVDYELSEEIIEKYFFESKRFGIGICRIISKHQRLSEEFIYKHSDKIDFKWLMENKYLDTYSYLLQDYILGEIIEKIRTRVNFFEDYVLIDYLTEYMREKYEKYRILC